MKRTGWLVLLALVIFAAAAARFAPEIAAQESAAAVANPVSTTVKNQLPRFSKNMVAAAEAMPAEKYGFKPTPEMNSFGHLVMHIAQSNNTFCAKISGQTPPEVKITDTDARSKLVTAVKASFAVCRGR